MPAASATFNVSREVFVLNNNNTGSDLLGEATAAFAALSVLFADTQPELSVTMSEHALQAYGQLTGWTKARTLAPRALAEAMLRLHVSRVAALLACTSACTSTTPACAAQTSSLLQNRIRDDMCGCDFDEARLQATKYSRLHPAFAIYEVVEPQAEIFLAAAWMFRMTGDELYKAEASARHAQVRAQLGRCSSPLSPRHTLVRGVDAVCAKTPSILPLGAGQPRLLSRQSCS